jgi:hypothetical protein
LSSSQKSAKSKRKKKMMAQVCKIWMDFKSRGKPTGREIKLNQRARIKSKCHRNNQLAIKSRKEISYFLTGSTIMSTLKIKGFWEISVLKIWPCFSSSTE